MIRTDGERTEYCSRECAEDDKWGPAFRGARIRMLTNKQLQEPVEVENYEF